MSLHRFNRRSRLRILGGILVFLLSQLVWMKVDGRHLLNHLVSMEPGATFTVTPSQRGYAFNCGEINP